MCGFKLSENYVCVVFFCFLIKKENFLKLKKKIMKNATNRFNAHFYGFYNFYVIFFFGILHTTYHIYIIKNTLYKHECCAANKKCK